MMTTYRLKGLAQPHPPSPLPRPLACRGADSQAAATIAGHRLHRVLGGATGVFALDHGTSACFARANEVVVVATFGNGGDPAEASRAADGVRSAIIDACGGKLSEVALATLAKHGAEIQLAMRRAALGFGRVPGISGSRFDFTAVTLLPDAPSDAKALVDLRSANDVTALGGAAATAEAAATGMRRAGVLADALRSLRLPIHSPSQPLPAAGIHGAVAAACAVSSRARLELLPLSVLVALRGTPAEDASATVGPLALEVAAMTAVTRAAPVQQRRRKQGAGKGEGLPPTLAAVAAATHIGQEERSDEGYNSDDYDEHYGGGDEFADGFEEGGEGEF